MGEGERKPPPTSNHAFHSTYSFSSFRNCVIVLAAHAPLICLHWQAFISKLKDDDGGALKVDMDGIGLGIELGAFDNGRSTEKLASLGTDEASLRILPYP